jgi:hypothetical protein
MERIMEKMLVTQALNELKLLDDRINKAINDAVLVIAAKRSEKKVNPNLTKEEFEIRAKAGYQSVLDLIERRKKIKAAVVTSNAVTKVTVHGEEMTVAEAIERKSTIDYEISLLRQMQSQWGAQNREMNMQNIRMEERIDKYIETFVGKDTSKAKDNELEAMIKPMRESGEYALVDPLSIEKKIADLDDYIKGFKSEVDAILQISNCNTWIEF